MINEILWKECQLEVCKDLSIQENLVISASGSIVENDLNLLYFKKDNHEEVKIVYLSAKDSVLAKRVIQKHSKINQKDALKQIQEFKKERDFGYQKWADLVLQTDVMKLSEIADLIINS